MDLHQSLFDIIGILIGFISIILLLSLVITCLVQALQAGLRLRARNLRHGLQSIAMTVLDKNPAEAGDLALKVLNAANICIIGRRDQPTSRSSRVIGPVISYIDPKELPQAFAEAGETLSDGLEKKVLDAFDKIWNQLENRFLSHIRLLTLGCSLVVAIYFQISAPDLLARLSVDEAWRNQIVADAENNANVELGEPETDENLAERALARLGTEFPELRDKLEEVSGVGNTKVSHVSELERVLADAGQGGKRAVTRYEELLDQLYAERRDAAAKRLEAAMGRLSKYNITGWPHGMVFYFQERSVQWANGIGVLMTAILLSFGAPFWFERLKEVLKFKDTLSKGIKPEEKKGKTKSADEQTGG